MVAGVPCARRDNVEGHDACASARTVRGRELCDHSVGGRHVGEAAQGQQAQVRIEREGLVGKGTARGGRGGLVVAGLGVSPSRRPPAAGAPCPVGTLVGRAHGERAN